jgi:hypothetical protein
LPTKINKTKQKHLSDAPDQVLTALELDGIHDVEQARLLLLGGGLVPQVLLVELARHRAPDLHVGTGMRDKLE